MHYIELNIVNIISKLKRWCAMFITKYLILLLLFLIIDSFIRCFHILTKSNPKEKKGTVTSVDAIKKRVKFRFDATKRRAWRSLHNLKRIIDKKD